MKHSFRILLLIALAMLLAFSSCAKNGKDGAPTGFVSATDEQADFTLYVPQNWKVDYSTAAAGAYYSASDPSSVSVMAWELPNADTTLDEWWELNRSEIESVFTEFAVVSDENTTVDGLYAKKVVYTASIGGYAYQYMQVAAIKGTSVYLFTYASVEENYETHLEEVAKMLEFLKIGS